MSQRKDRQNRNLSALVQLRPCRLCGTETVSLSSPSRTRASSIACTYDELADPMIVQLKSTYYAYCRVPAQLQQTSMPRNRWGASTTNRSSPMRSRAATRARTEEKQCSDFSRRSRRRAVRTLCCYLSEMVLRGRPLRDALQGSHSTRWSLPKLHSWHIGPEALRAPSPDLFNTIGANPDVRERAVSWLGRCILVCGRSPAMPSISRHLRRSESRFYALTGQNDSRPYSWRVPNKNGKTFQASCFGVDRAMIDKGEVGYEMAVEQGEPSVPMPPGM